MGLDPAQLICRNLRLDLEKCLNNGGSCRRVVHALWVTVMSLLVFEETSSDDSSSANKK